MDSSRWQDCSQAKQLEGPPALLCLPQGLHSLDLAVTLLPCETPARPPSAGLLPCSLPWRPNTPGVSFCILICRCCTRCREMSKSWVSWNCCSLSQFQLPGVSHTAPSPCTTCNSIIVRHMFSAKHGPEMQANSFIWHSTENAPLCSKALENSRCVELTEQPYAGPNRTPF